jgi:TPR repeat protein
MYFAGPVEVQNSAEAVKWFRLAADQGDAVAQYFLGYMYADGRGVPKNYVNAYIWLNLSAAQGDRVGGDVAVKLRDLVEQRMTPVQLTEAKKFAYEWKSKSSPH